MTPSRFLCSILIVLWCSNNVRSLSHAVGGTTGPNRHGTKSSSSSSAVPAAAVPSRRDWLVRIGRQTPSVAAAAAAIAAATAAVPAAANAAGGDANLPSVEAAKTQWKRGLATLEDLQSNWADTATSGDAIRTKLGTQGTVSPLFQIDKAFKSLRDSPLVDDFIEFQETAEDFGLALSRADSMAYSANFAGGSGKPTPPAVYIEKSRIEVAELLRIGKKLDAMIQ